MFANINNESVHYVTLYYLFEIDSLALSYNNNLIQYINFTFPSNHTNT